MGLVVILAQPCDNLVTIQWFLELENKCGREKTIREKKVSKKALGNAPGEKKVEKHGWERGGGYPPDQTENAAVLLYV